MKPRPFEYLRSLHVICAAVMLRFDALPQELSKDVFLLCLPRTSATSLYTETAMWTQEAELRGQSFFGGPSEVSVLSGKK